MTSISEALPGPAEQAVRSALAALGDALRPEDGAVTAATETWLQTALHFLRKEKGRSELLDRLEAVAASLHVMAEARRTGRVNLYASRLARLRRFAAASAF